MEDNTKTNDFENTERVALKQHFDRNNNNNNNNTKTNREIVFHPHGPFRLIWDMLVMIILIYTCIRVPFTFAFDIILTLDEGTGIFSLLIDCLLLIDVCFNFRTAYYDFNDKALHFELITNPKQIAYTYIKTWFLLDIFTSIPFEFLIVQNTQLQLIKLLRIFRLLRLFQLLRFLAMIKTFYHYNINNNNNNNVLHLLYLCLCSAPFVVILKSIRILSIMLLTAHYIACIWWYFGKMSLEYYDESWLSNDNLDLLQSHYSVSVTYMKAFYFGVVTLFNNTADITPTNTMEEIVASFIILFGICFFALIVAAVSNEYAIANSVGLRHVQRVQAKAFCVSNKLPPSLSIVVMAHLIKHNNNNKINIDCLPPQIQRCVAKHCDEEKRFYIANVQIFQDLNGFIRGLIALQLKGLSCCGEEYLFEKYEFEASKMYIQTSGECLMSFNGNGKSKNVVINRGGAVFGYFSFLNPGLRRQCTVKTLCFCEFWCLDMFDVINVLKQTFPTTWHRFWKLIKGEIQILYKNQQIQININCNDNDNKNKNKNNIDYEFEINLMQKEAEKHENENENENESDMEVEEETKLNENNIDMEVEEEKIDKTKFDKLEIPKPKQIYIKKKKKKRKKKQIIKNENEESLSSNSMFGENSLNSLSHSIAMTDDNDHGPDHASDDCS